MVGSLAHSLDMLCSRTHNRASLESAPRSGVFKIAAVQFGSEAAFQEQRFRPSVDLALRCQRNYRPRCLSCTTRANRASGPGPCRAKVILRVLSTPVGALALPLLLGRPPVMPFFAPLSLKWFSAHHPSIISLFQVGCDM